MSLNDAMKNYFDSQGGQAVLTKAITFDGGTPNAIGDHDGTGDPFTIATVTGTVVVRVIAVCTTALVGAATLEVGTVGYTAKIIAQIADAEDIDVNEIWHDATCDSSVEAFTVAPELIVANGLDIIGTVGTANITAGVITFYIMWRPISDGATVTVS
jgi:hypothetical protein